VQQAQAFGSMAGSVVTSSFVHLMKFSAMNPRHRKATYIIGKIKNE